jgi:hypothetical protein
VTDAPPQVGICRDCNYPLRELPDPRCPECGRAFDPKDPATMNMGRPMGAVCRWIMGRAAWPSTAVMLFIACWLFWMGTDPALYDYFMSVLCPLGALVLVVAGIVLWESVRVSVAKAHHQPAPDLALINSSRARWLAVLMLAVAASIPLQIPLRIGFALSRPSFDRFIREVQANPSAARPAVQRLGIYRVSTQIRETDNAIMVFLSSDVGFAYSKDGERPHLVGIATNSLEPLQERWYWYVGD